ncbi:DUF2937 family protein [Stappia sp. MMSF_3263]|uniref:DUF2937 family protein n=1 Tax=Stappia sp. MMSF_3263 TaxID=3046693 RepID=UPI00273D102D|nr:DUF2937 family protein [Stappia sp. MMSF_3263]
MIARTLALALALVGGVTTSQLPEFAQQYRQRLGGAIDALTQVVDDFREDAARQGLSMQEAIGRLSRTSDDFVATQGARVERSVERLDALVRQRDALREAGPFQRLTVFLRDLDPQLAQATFEDFEPAVPATAEGAVAAGGGFLGLLLTFGLLGRIVRRMRRRPG